MHRSFEIENFFHHRKAFAAFQLGQRLEQRLHRLLPALIHRVLVEYIPGAFEIVHMHKQKEIHAPAEDGVLRDAHVFQQLYHFRPESPMSLFVRLDAVGPYAKSECNARHHSYYRLNGMLPQPLTSVGRRPTLATMTTRAQASNDCEAAADRCLAAIAATAGEGARTYTQVYASSVLKEATGAG